MNINEIDALSNRRDLEQIKAAKKHLASTDWSLPDDTATAPPPPDAPQRSQTAPETPPQASNQQ